MTKQEAITLAKSYKWYHTVRLFEDFTTESYMVDLPPVWNNIRKVRNGIDYSGKRVLDVGSMDGMWAFEAEELGATEVVASDVWQEAPVGEARCRLAIEIRQGKVKLVDKCDVHFLRRCLALEKADGPYDIIQALGLLYHLENPMMALNEMRSVCASDGVMILETAFWENHNDSPMCRCNADNGIYCDKTTFWAPNRSCLDWMLNHNGWRQTANSGIVMDGEFRRVCVVCNAI